MRRYASSLSPVTLLLLLACLFLFLLAWPVGLSTASEDFDNLMDLWSEKLGYVHVTSLEQWQEKRMVIQEVLLDFLLPHPDELQPLNLTVLSEEDMGGYTRRKIEYSTLPDERVRAWLLIPQRGNTLPAPGILALHQTTECGKDEVVGLGCDPELDYGLELVRRGYVVLAPDGITMGERFGKVPYGAPFADTRAIYKKFPHWSALGIMTWEAIQAVNVLVSTPEVDSTRIGCIGHSHGGYGTMFLVDFDPRIKAAVSSCGFMGLCHDSDPFRWVRSSGFVFMPELRPYVRKRPFPFDFHEVLALAAPIPFLNVSASNDPIFPGSGESSILATVKVKEVYENIYGAGDRLTNLVHSSKHSFPSFARQEAYRWFDMWLKGKHVPQRLREEQSQAGGAQLLARHKVNVRVDSRENGSNVFCFSAATNAGVSLAIYDVTGRKIKTLVDGRLEPGPHEIAWDGRCDNGKTATPGIYFYRLENGEKIYSGKLFVLR